jgi:hypothetical protein
VLAQYFDQPVEDPFKISGKMGLRPQNFDPSMSLRALQCGVLMLARCFQLKQQEARHSRLLTDSVQQGYIQARLPQESCSMEGCLQHLDTVKVYVNGNITVLQHTVHDMHHQWHMPKPGQPLA